MRLVLTSFIVAGLMTRPAAAADCLRPADQTAMDVVGLKTQLMLTAITCKSSQPYNSFIKKYLSDVQDEEKALDAYFKRAYGRAAAKERDNYVTQLANTQSQVGLRQGTGFCAQSGGLFDEVLALRNTKELTQYAAGRVLAQPTSAINCEPDAPAAVEASTAARPTGKKKARARKARSRS